MISMLLQIKYRLVDPPPNATSLLIGQQLDVLPS